MSAGYPFPTYGAGASGGLGNSSAPDRRPNQYPTASPLPAHYPVPGGAPAASSQQYPSATHSNPLSRPIPAGQAPAPVNPWGFPSPALAAQHPPPGKAAPPEPPANRPDNMSSLTHYCVKVKEQFVLPPKVPPAKLETVTPCSHNLTTTIEDEILSDAEARRLDASASPDPSGALDRASSDLLGGLSALEVGGTSGAVPLPSADSQSVAIDLYTQMKAGSVTAVSLALAKYSAEDEEHILAFCESFDKCKEVASGASDLEIAAALFVTGEEIAAGLSVTEENKSQWRQKAMHVLMPNV